MASSLPLGEEEVSKVREELLSLDKELEDFEWRLREMNEQTMQSIDQLSIDCNSKCSNLQQEFDAFIEEARLKAGELCENMKEKTIGQQSKLRLSIKKNENLLEEMEEWLHLNADADDEDAVRGMQTVGAKLSSRLHESLTPVEKGHLVVTFPEWCHRSLNQLKKVVADFTVETWPPRNLELERECQLPGSNLVIFSIVVSDDDGHIFIADWDDRLIVELSESGEVVGQILFRDTEEKFYPRDMCCLSEDIVVVCGCLRDRGGRLLFWARKKSPPFLEKEKIINTKKPFSSLCQMNEQIFACDFYFNEIDCFSKNGEKIKTIHIGGLPGSCPYYDPLLRADPTTGNLWGTVEELSEIFVFNQNGQILETVKTEEEICDFRGNKFGLFFFCTEEGIFSLLPKNVLYKFPQKSENLPKIFVTSKKLFVCLENDRKLLMKIFKIN